MIVPHNRHLLCKQVAGKQRIQDGAIVFDQDALPEFEVLASATDLFKVSDRIASSSFGTKLDDNGEVKYLIDEKDVIGKLYG